jgi:hypothetical protein
MRLSPKTVVPAAMSGKGRVPRLKGYRCSPDSNAHELHAWNPSAGALLGSFGTLLSDPGFMLQDVDALQPAFMPYNGH